MSRPHPARIVLCILLAGAMRHASGQAWEVFNMANAGLPSNTVTDVLVQPDGVVWAATDWGLWRLEDGEAQVFQVGNSGLPDNSLRCLALDGQGHLWIGTSISGAVRYDGQDWEVFSTLNSPMPDDQVNTIHRDQQGWLWFGTVSGLACFTGSEWRLYDSSPSSYNGRILNGNHILSIDTRSDGLMVLGTLNGGFHFLTDTSVHFFTTFNSGFWDNTQRGVLLDTVANERWVATPAAGLLRQFGDWYGGTWFQYSTFNSDLPSNALLDLARGPDGSLWLATQVAGLVRRQANGTYQAYTTSNSGLPVNTLNCVTVPEDGTIWIGTYDGGVARFNPTLGWAPEEARNQQLSIAPSLNDGRFTVRWPQGAPVEAWRIHDLSGRTVAEGRLNGGVELRFTEPGLPKGGYIITLHGDGKPISGRFLVH